MKHLNQICYLLVFGALAASIIWQPSYPAAIALVATGLFYVLTKDDDGTVINHIEPRDQRLDVALGNIEDLKSKVSNLSLAVGLKKRE